MNLNTLMKNNCTKANLNRMEFWEQILNFLNIKKMAEIGVWKGDFSSHMLKKVASIEKYYMIDPWKKLDNWNKPFNVDDTTFENVFLEAMQKTRFASDKIEVLRGRTLDVINHIQDETLDFAYIDGDHTLRGITIDLMSIFPKIKGGG